MSQADAAYYLRRAREERERAEQATLANAAAIHKKLAERYEALAKREELTASVATTSNGSLTDGQAFKAPIL
jgi:hypothetical protein